MKVLLFRHGLTAGNREQRYLGVTDPPLCPEGREALLSLPLWEEIAEVWVTPLCRTVETASILFPHATQRVCQGLSEMNFGDFENQNWRQLSHNPDYQHWLDTNCEAPCPKGESRGNFIRRCCRAFEALVKQASKKERDEPLCIVAHGGTIMALLSTYALPQADYFSYQTPCGGHWVLELSQARWLENKTLEILQCP